VIEKELPSHAWSQAPIRQRQETFYRGGRPSARHSQARAPRLQVPAATPEAERSRVGARGFAREEPKQRDVQRFQIAQAGGHEPQRCPGAQFAAERRQLLAPHDTRSGPVPADTPYDAQGAALC